MLDTTLPANFLLCPILSRTTLALPIVYRIGSIVALLGPVSTSLGPRHSAVIYWEEKGLAQGQAAGKTHRGSGSRLCL